MNAMFLIDLKDVSNELLAYQRFAVSKSLKRCKSQQQGCKEASYFKQMAQDFIE